MHRYPLSQSNRNGIIIKDKFLFADPEDLRIKEFYFGYCNGDINVKDANNFTVIYRLEDGYFFMFEKNKQYWL